MSQCSCILVVLLGLPASGKSWLAEKLCSFLSENNCVVNCVHYDDIVSLEEQAKIALSSTSERTKKYRRDMRVQVESILTKFKSSSTKSVVIVDDNNYYRSMRYEYYQLAAKYYVGYLQIFVQCKASDALLYNMSRPESSRVPDIVIMEMDNKFESPCESWENFLTVERIGLGEKEALIAIWNRIQQSLNNPVATIKILEEKKIVSLQNKLCNDHNILHNVDKVLRRKVSQTVRERKEENARVLALRLNDIRQSILESIKTGVIVTPTDAWTSDGAINLPNLEAWVVSIFLQQWPVVNDDTCPL